MASSETQQMLRAAMRHLRAGQNQQAEALLGQILQLQPDCDPAIHLLGALACAAGRPHEAAELFRQAIALNPSAAEYHYNLANALHALGQHDQAVCAMQEALRLRPDMPEAHVNLGVIYMAQNRLDEAARCFQRALDLRPGDPGVHVNLGHLARRQGRLHQAAACFRKACELLPTYAPAYSSLGSCLRECGLVQEAIACFRKAITLDPGFCQAHSNLVYALLFDPASTPQSIFDELQLWERRHALPIYPSIRPHHNDPTPDRRLRVGYVSPNLRRHVVGFFMEVILANHDRQQVEVFCYSDASVEDDISTQLRQYADHWRQTACLTHGQLAQLIRDDRIDILVDLNQHMANCRLPVFAHKPAPVQVTYLGYNATTGLRTIDWRLTDPHMSPAGTEQQWTAEKLAFLPETYWCYRVCPGAPPVADLPARRNGFVTFASFNSLAKINPRVIAVWSGILRQHAGSRLKVAVRGGRPEAAELLSVFRHQGVPESSIQVDDYREYPQYLAGYNDVDIALDTFPYNGGTTTLDALWMGVPVVTLAGWAGVWRAGVTLLTNAGLPELITHSPEQYVAVACELAGQLPRLSLLRNSLRQRLLQSPLTDAARFTRNLEALYRRMWHEWCGRQQPA